MPMSRKRTRAGTPSLPEALLAKMLKSRRVAAPRRIYSIAITNSAVSPWDCLRYKYLSSGATLIAERLVLGDLAVVRVVRLLTQ